MLSIRLIQEIIMKTCWRVMNAYATGVTPFSLFSIVFLSMTHIYTNNFSYSVSFGHTYTHTLLSTPFVEQNYTLRSCGIIGHWEWTLAAPEGDWAFFRVPVWARSVLFIVVLNIGHLVKSSPHLFISASMRCTNSKRGYEGVQRGWDRDIN